MLFSVARIYLLVFRVTIVPPPPPSLLVIHAFVDHFLHKLFLVVRSQWIRLETSFRGGHAVTKAMVQVSETKFE